MSVLALIGALSAGIGAAKVTAWLLKRSAERAAEHTMHALIRREPGLALAAYDDRNYIAECEADDNLDADGAWTAFYPPGSLGPHPETKPIYRGRIRTRRRDIDRLIVEIEAQQRVDARRRGHAP